MENLLKNGQNDRAVLFVRYFSEEVKVIRNSLAGEGFVKNLNSLLGKFVVKEMREKIAKTERQRPSPQKDRELLVLYKDIIAHTRGKERIIAIRVASRHAQLCGNAVRMMELQEMLYNEPSEILRRMQIS